MRPELETALEVLRRGEANSAEEALSLLQSTVFNFSMKVCGHHEDAEDTMQEVLLKFLPYLSRFDNPQALAVWLYRVARNSCLTKRRRGKFAPSEHISLEELMPAADELAAISTGKDSTPEALTLKGEDASLLRQAVLGVPAQYRLVLVLHDMEGLSTEEVARVTQLKEGTVRVRLHRARLFVRKELAKLRSGGPFPKRSTAANKPSRCRQLFAALSDYMDGVLDGASCEELEKHLRGCAPCEKFLDSLERTVEQCRSLDGGCKPKRAEKLRKQLLEEYRRVVTALQEQT